MDVNREGILVNNQRIPLWSGEVQFWRIDSRNWENALGRVKRLGLPIVATYLSWRRHEPQPNVFDFDGHTDPRLNVPKFLGLCRQLGLYVHLKPGPWICAEEPGGGYPDWLVQIPGIQVLDANDQPVLGYNPPFQSSIPCLLHPEYLKRAKYWLTAVDEVIRPYCYPQGPVLLIQLDNEPSLAFHDRMFESDYNPLIVGDGGQFQIWLDQTGRSRDSYPPPRSLEVAQWSDLRRYFDWAEYKEWMLASHIAFLGSIHRLNGLANVLFTTNLNEHEQLSTPNQWLELQQASGLIGYDYYFVPPFQERDLINVALAANYSQVVAPLVWAPEMMAGIWVTAGVDQIHPGFKLKDVEFFHFLGLAFGLKGMNFYMAVNRENWEDAPIREDGEPGATYAGIQRVLELRQKIPGFDHLQPVREVAMLFDPMIAREAYVSSGKEIQLDGYQLGSAYRLFYDIYQKLVHLNYNPALIDSRTNLRELTQYRVVFIPAAPYLNREVEAHLVEAARAGVKVVFLESFPHLDDEFIPWTIPSGESLSVIPIGNGEWSILQSGNIQEFLKEIHLAPVVKSNDADVLAIIQNDGQVEVLFVVNAGIRAGRVSLAFRDLEVGSLQDVIFPSHSIMIRHNIAILNLSPHSVSVYLIQR